MPEGIESCSRYQYDASWVGAAWRFRQHNRTPSSAVTAESHRVTSLPGLAVDSKIVHYAGLLTVDAEKEGNMFYWLIEAEGVDPVTGTHSVPFRWAFISVLNLWLSWLYDSVESTNVLTVKNLCVSWLYDWIESINIATVSHCKIVRLILLRTAGQITKFDWCHTVCLSTDIYVFWWPSQNERYL